MLKVSYGEIIHSRKEILSRLQLKKSINPDFRVIDIGGIEGTSWSLPVVDMIIDIKAKNTEKSMAFDICDEQAWCPLLEYVNQNGVFDYAICTHTLEDIYNPVTTLKYLPKIARAGVVTMPSINTDMSKIENSKYKGYIHHRWMFDAIDGNMILIPKLGLIELMFNHIRYKKTVEEIRFDWEGKLPYKMFMDNYLGPDVQTVLNNYIRIIGDSECVR